MRLVRLVRRQMHSHPVRYVLTVAAIAVAMFLFCFLRSLLTTLDAAVKASATNRLIASSAVSFFQYLPRSYGETLSGLEGVESVSPFSWFGGKYRDDAGFFAQFATEAEVLLRQYPEVVLPEEEKRAFLADRKSAIVGVGLAEKYDWKVGDDLPLLGTIYPRVDGTEWRFTIRGIYRSTKANVDELTMYFHTQYLEEVVDRGDCYGPKGTGAFMLKVADGYGGEEVAARIDQWFDGGPQRTRTQTEAAFSADFVKMLGNLPTFLGLIVGAVLVAIFFGVVNTMTIAARERTRTIGILKALGFPDVVPARLFAVEAVVLSGVGTGLGIALSLLTQGGIRAFLGNRVPGYTVTPETLVTAGLMGLAVALLSGGIPALRARRLAPVEALRLEG